MRRVIYYMSFLIFSLISLGQDFRGEISKFYSNDVLAVGTTNRVRFSAEVTLTKDFANNQDYFQLDLKNGNKFLNLNNIKVSPINSIKEGNKIYFKSSTNGEIIKEIKFLLEGEALFNWLVKNQKDENIRIGYINDEFNPVYLNLSLQNFNPVQSLKIRVIDNMNLGKGEAGERLSTKKWGTPANISIEGEENKSVNITIPESTTIKNSKNESLIVDLSFRENGGQKLVKLLAPNNRDVFRIGNESRVVSKDILIDGETQTQKGNRGVYKGMFTVKVEYLD